MNGSRDPAACHAAIHGLLHAIPEEQRPHAAAFLLGELARLYEAAGRPFPEGLRVLREHGGNVPGPDGATVTPGVAHGLDPRSTIYTPGWADARVRAELVPEHGGLYTAALDAVEQAWMHLRPLQRWYEQERPGAVEKGDYPLLLDFVDGDLVDTFRVVAVGVTELVPGAPDWPANADPGDVDGWLSTFVRYLGVFRLAVAGGDVPAPFRDAVLDAADALERSGWYGRLGTLLGMVEGADWGTREKERHD